MQKIDTIFERGPKGQIVAHRPMPSCGWVFRGEGVATRKWDGACCAIIEGVLYKRVDWDAEKGPAPDSWRHWSGNTEQRSGHGWLPVRDDPADWMFREAFARGIDFEGKPVADGTFEMCGPKCNKNPDRLVQHSLIPHGRHELPDFPRTPDAMQEYLTAHDIEGVVWHHPDGRMAKIKARDFGIKRG